MHMIRSLWNDSTSPEMHCKPTFSQQKDVSFFQEGLAYFRERLRFLQQPPTMNTAFCKQFFALELPFHIESAMQLTPMHCHAYKPPSQEYGSFGCGIPAQLRPLSPNSTHPFCFDSR